MLCSSKLLKDNDNFLYKTKTINFTFCGILKNLVQCSQKNDIIFYLQAEHGVAMLKMDNVKERNSYQLTDKC